MVTDFDTNEHNQLEIFREQHQKLESVWQKDEDNIEFIYARDLQIILGYSTWQKFQIPIKKSKESCIASKNNELDHFNHVVKMVETGSGAIRKIDDIKLTRYACYLIAMNGDSRKGEIAYAQRYFAVATRKFELILKRMEELERIDSREKYTESEKEFGRVIYERGVKGQSFAVIKSKGDAAFFGGHNTKQMKAKLSVPEKSPLTDYTNKAVNLGKALANTITTMNVQSNDLHGENDISKEHIQSNKNVRNSLTKSGIYPENLPPEEDIKKVKSRINKEAKEIAKKQSAKKLK